MREPNGVSLESSAGSGRRGWRGDEKDAPREVGRLPRAGGAARGPEMPGLGCRRQTASCRATGPKDSGKGVRNH